MTHENICKKEFIDLIEKFAEKSDDYYIGAGNPNAKILIIGKEGSVESIPEKEISTVSKWLPVITNNEEVIFTEKRDKPLAQGHTYTKYQKLHDYIFCRDQGISRNEVDFFKNIFISEMNINRAKTSKEASKQGMQQRKDEFFRDTEFIQQFPVVILACGSYVENHEKKEINSIFNVEFKEEYLSDNDPKAQPFWVHTNADKTKLVIHTRQLSFGVRDTLLKKMAEVIKEFLQK